MRHMSRDFKGTGLDFHENAQKEGRMFSTEFDEHFCETRLSAVHRAIMALPEGNNYVDDTAEDSPFRRLPEWIADNVELFLYAIRCRITMQDLQSRRTGILRCLQRANELMDDERGRLQADRLRHVMSMWPNTPTWSSVTLMLCWLYQELPPQYNDRELTNLFFTSCTTKANWDTAVRVLLTRAQRHSNELRTNYSTVFIFLRNFGDTPNGANSRGILVPHNVYNQILREYFQALGPEDQDRVLALRERLLGSNDRAYALTSRMKQRNSGLLNTVLEMKAGDPEGARELFLRDNDPFADAERYKELEDSDIVEWMVEWASGAQCGNVPSAQKSLLNLLSLARNNGAQVRRSIHRVLSRYSELDPENADVVSRCITMILNPLEVTDGEIDALLQDYCRLDPGEYGHRRIERIWRYLLQNNALRSRVQSGVERIIAGVDAGSLRDVQSLRVKLSGIYRMNDSYGDGIAGIVPHQAINSKLREILENRHIPEKRRELNDLFAEAEGILEQMLNAETAITQYRETLADLNRFCGANVRDCIQMTTANQVERLARRFHL